MAGWAARRRIRLDAGRAVMVPLAALTLVLDVRGQIVALLASGSGFGPDSAPGSGRELMLRAATVLLACSFYALIIWCYLRRGPAVATSPSVMASAIAVVATCTPFLFPLLAAPAVAGAVGGGAGRQLAADLLLVAGTGWSVWSLRHLGRNLSVIAQARAVCGRGPYRFVRHPLYLGEIVSCLGLALAAGRAIAFCLWAVLVLMQAYRAVREEQVLLRALPGYRDYRARTAALLPGVF